MAANSDQIRALLDKLERLPAEQVGEVEDFIDFLITRATKKSALDRLLSIAPSLEAAGVEPMSEEAIEVEVQAARQERLSEETIL